METTYITPQSEQELIQAVSHKDVSAFEVLYQLYEKRVYQYVRTLIRDSVVAEDILIETMTAVWQGAVSYKQTSAVSTWIFGIARHKALDLLRRPMRQGTNVPLQDIADLADSREGPLDGVHRTELGALTRKALGRLSRDHQEILRLVFYEELPYKAIAALLTIPENTIKTRVYYAKRRLKQELDSLDPKETLS